MNIESTSKKIINTLVEKSSIKNIVFDETVKRFNMLKKVLEDTVIEFNDALEDYDERLHLKYEVKGEFDVQVSIASETLVFSAHTNIFDFYRQHRVRKTKYIKSNKLNALVGTIHIYNFLTDSFKYNRAEDLGYLIARVFINQNGHYFVEGKQQLGCCFKEFGSVEMSEIEMKRIILSALLYALNFELLVPLYENVTLISVADIIAKMQHTKIKTAKRMGFRFNTDDV